MERCVEVIVPAPPTPTVEHKSDGGRFERRLVLEKQLSKKEEERTMNGKAETIAMTILMGAACCHPALGQAPPAAILEVDVDVGAPPGRAGVSAQPCFFLKPVFDLPAGTPV